MDFTLLRLVLVAVIYAGTGLGVACLANVPGFLVTRDPDGRPIWIRWPVLVVVGLAWPFFVLAWSVASWPRR